MGCLALQYLARATKRYSIETIPYLSEIMPDIIEIIGSATLDKVEQGVILISFLVLKENPKIKSDLVNLDFFGTVLPHFLSEKFEFRQLCAITCARIYKNSIERQKIFIKKDGIVNLMQAIGLGPLRGRFFSELIQCLIDIIEVFYI